MATKAKWQTKDGQLLNVAFMDSVHLLHSANMVIRNYANQPVYRANFAVSSSVYKEAIKRGYKPIDKQPGSAFRITNFVYRESRKQLCMLQALLEVSSHNAQPRPFTPEQLDDYIERSKDHPELFARYLHYLMTKG